MEATRNAYRNRQAVPIKPLALPDAVTETKLLPLELSERRSLPNMCEPISPELVLVSPDLAERVRAKLPEPPQAGFVPTSHPVARPHLERQRAAPIPYAEVHDEGVAGPVARQPQRTVGVQPAAGERSPTVSHRPIRFAHRTAIATAAIVAVVAFYELGPRLEDPSFEPTPASVGGAQRGLAVSGPPPAREKPPAKATSSGPSERSSHPARHKAAQPRRSSLGQPSAATLKPGRDGTASVKPPREPLPPRPAGGGGYIFGAGHFRVSTDSRKLTNLHLQTTCAAGDFELVLAILPDGTFRFAGPAATGTGTAVILALEGRFVSASRAVGTLQLRSPGCRTKRFGFSARLS